MVEAIGTAILSAIAAAGATTTAAAITGATVLGVSGATIVGTVAVLGGSLLIRELTTPDVRQRVAGQQFPTSQTLPPRRRAYGRVKLSGPYVVKKSYGGKFYTDIYLVEGPIGGFFEYWLDDVKAGLAPGSLGGPSNAAPWGNYVAIEAFLGGPDQLAAGLLSELPFRTAAHRLRGCAHVATVSVAPKEKDFAKVFPSGTPPATRVVIDSSLVRNTTDPAQTADPASWKYTNLCGPCIRDFVMHEDYGLRLPADLVDEPSFAAFTTLCAQTVTNRAGASVPRYTLGGLFELTDQFADTLQGMLDACDGRFFLTPEGKVGITGGRYIAPDVTIPARAILSIASLEKGNGRRATVNRLKTSFVSPLHDYQVVEGAIWDDAAGQAALGETLEDDFPRPWVQDHNQLQRLAKIHVARKNPAYRITGMVTNLEGAAALFEDTVLVDLSRYGLGTLPFAVDRPVLSADGATCVFDLSSIDPQAWTFNAAIEEGEPPAVSDAGGTVLPPIPAGLAVTVERRTVSASTIATFLRLTATPSARADLSLIGRYRLKGTEPWLDMVPDGEDAYSLLSSVLADGATYEVQGALATYGRSTQSAWIAATPAEVIATADPVAPAAPAYTSATVSGATVNHAVKQSPSANARSVQLVRALGFDKVLADAAVVASAILAPNQAETLSDTIDLGLYRYWLRAANGSGILSDPAGPLTALRLLQPGNLLTAPTDLTAAAWAKVQVTAALSGTAPDGSAATLLSETTVNNPHYVEQTAIPIIAGSRYRAAMALRANSRSQHTLFLGEGGFVNYAGITADLSTGAATVTTSGAGGAAMSPAVSLIRVSADWWLLLVSATVATSTARVRLSLRNDAGAGTYAGDTTKGVYVAAATLAPVSA